MKKNKKYVFILLNFILLLTLVSFSAFQEEQYRKNDSFYLKLAPVDPRSFMQGDYMVLNYEIVNIAREKLTKLEQKEHRIIKRGFLVLRLNNQKVAEFEDVVEEAFPDSNLLFIAFRSNGFNITINADSFLFQEGEASRYEGAKYAKVVLVDRHLRILDLVNNLP